MCESRLNVLFLQPKRQFEAPDSHRDSGYLVSVPRLLVYICPPTSMWTGALDLVSWAGVGIPPEPSGDREISG